MFTGVNVCLIVCWSDPTGWRSSSLTSSPSQLSWSSKDRWEWRPKALVFSYQLPVKRNDKCVVKCRSVKRSTSWRTSWLNLYKTQQVRVMLSVKSRLMSSQCLLDQTEELIYSNCGPVSRFLSLSDRTVRYYGENLFHLSCRLLNLHV